MLCVRSMPLILFVQWKGPHLNTAPSRPSDSLPETEGAISPQGLWRPWILYSWHLWTSPANTGHQNLDFWVPTFGLFHLLTWLLSGSLLRRKTHKGQGDSPRTWTSDAYTAKSQTPFYWEDGVLTSLVNSGLINLPFPYRMYSLSHTL